LSNVQRVRTAAAVRELLILESCVANCVVFMTLDEWQFRHQASRRGNYTKQGAGLKNEAAADRRR
jgi:hypothetical protein